MSTKVLKLTVILIISIMSGVFCYAQEAPDDKVIALTFDDGPHAKYTPMILDILKKYNARATFFVIGERAEKSPEIISRTFSEGHSVGNHTYDHTELTQLSNNDISAQISKTSKIIEEITGKNPILMRPPLGGRNKRIDGLIKKQNMYTILWNVDPRDWYYKDAQRIYSQVINKAKSGDIIILHDFYQNTATATEKILDTLSDEGYRFVTVDEMLKLKGPGSGNVYYSRSLEHKID